MLKPGRPSNDRPRRVLIVDDEPAMQQVVERIARDAGYETAVASDAATALVLWDRDGPFDLLVTDLMMPGMLGQEFARTVQARTPGTRVIYLSAFSIGSYAAPPALAPQEAYLEKPVRAAALKELMSQLLFGHTRGPIVVLPG